MNFRLKEHSRAHQFLLDGIANDTIHFWDVKTINKALMVIEGHVAPEIIAGLQRDVLEKLIPPQFRTQQASKELDVEE